MGGVSSAISRAQLDANVTYGPRESQLRTLLSQAYQNFQQGLQINKGTAASIIAAAQQAMPKLHAVYAQATGDTQQGYQQLHADLGTLSSAADPFKAVSDREATAAVQRLTEADAQSQQAQTERVGNATAGEAFGEQNLYRGLVRDVGSVQQGQSDLLKEKGAFVASQGARYQDAADRLAQQSQQSALNRANQVDIAKLHEASQTSRQQSSQQFKLDHPGAGKAPKRSGFSTSRDASETEKINRAWSIGQQLRGAGNGEAGVRRALGAEFGLPGHAATDLLFHSRLTPGTQQQYVQLGYHVPGQWRPPAAGPWGNTGQGYR